MTCLGFLLAVEERNTCVPEAIRFCKRVRIDA